MNKYIGEQCPICKNKFNENDNIVVCPICGTPYHKECYLNNGKCLFENKHSDNFSWKPSSSQTKGDDESSQKSTKNCPRCNQENDQDALFCNKCGMPLNSINFEKNQYNSSFGSIPFILDPFGGINEDEKIQGVVVKDIAKYVKTKTSYYLNVFKRLEDLNVGKFSFSGFLFSGAWLLYRKQYKLGSILTFIVAMCMILNTFISYNYSQPILNSLLAAENIDITSTSIYSMSNVLSQSIYLLKPEEIFFIFTPLILSIIKWSTMLFVGFRGNRIYFNNTIKNINIIKRDSVSEEEYSNKLSQKGGVNTQLGFCLFICYLLINWLPQFLI